MAAGGIMPRRMTKEELFEEEKKRVKKFLRKHPEEMQEIIFELRKRKIKQLKKR